MKKYSRQRELILNSLQNRCDHPTAEMLYLDLKKEMPNIGIATVYRNLLEMFEEGKILKLKSESGPDRFDGNVKPHIHFTCNKCKKVYDIFYDNNKIDEEFEKLASTIGAISESSQIAIQGTCKECKN